MLVARPLSSAAPGNRLGGAVVGQLIPSAGPRNPAPLIRSRGAMRSARSRRSARGRARFVLRLRGQHIGAAVASLRLLASSAAAPRQPALASPRDHLCASCGSTTSLQTPTTKRASVHIHTRTQHSRRVLIGRMGRRAPREAVEQSIGSASACEMKPLALAKVGQRPMVCGKATAVRVW